MKKFFICICIFLITIFLVILVLFINKKIKIGNNINSQDVEENLSNIKSYELIAEINIKSNKNENYYKIKQKYEKLNDTEEVIEQEVLEPEAIQGLKTVKRGNVLTIENSKLNQKTVFENYHELSENYLDLISFIKDYKKDENSSLKKQKDEKILITKNKTLYINKNNEPIKMEVQDANKNKIVYILYKEVNILYDTQINHT